MNLTHKLFVATGLLACLVAADGCQEVKEKSRSTMSFVKGDADFVADRTPAQVMDASRAVAGEMNLVVINSATTQADEKTVHVLTARSADDKKVAFRATPESATATRVSVNTGLFGDSALREQALTKLKSRLGVAATTAPTTQAAH